MRRIVPQIMQLLGVVIEIEEFAVRLPGVAGHPVSLRDQRAHLEPQVNCKGLEPVAYVDINLSGGIAAIFLILFLLG